MARSTPALVEAAVLKWARESAGYSVDEAAKKLQAKPEKIEFWESGDKLPSIAKVRDMSAVYRRPIHLFFLDRPPVDPPVPHDFRRLPANGVTRYEPALRFQVRDAYERRQVAIDLAAELDVKPAPFTPKTTLQANPEQTGQQIRRFLDVTIAEQKISHRTGDNYRLWRSKIEAKDILVFQITGLATKQMLGMSLSFDILPVIGVNRKLKPNGRVFTLLHEFTHLMLRESGVCDLSEDHLQSPREQRTEIFANAVAAAALLPAPELLAEPVVTARGPGQHDWPNHELELLAAMFGVSEETILRRLLTLDRTSRAFYQRKRAEYLARYKRIEEQEQEEAANTEFKRNRPREVLTDYGRPYTRLVLMNYAQDRITLTDASSMLRVKAPMVEKIEKMLLEQ
jgi:Zn-dependent peptidase ImmA (M78 family)/transcriptional regulator with XRE-family HTH domain